jgi:hypothetical protein
MEAVDLPVEDGRTAARLVRALGQHRYVAGRTHLVHAFVFDAASGMPAAPEVLAEGRAWAATVFADTSIELDSRDPRLYRTSTDAEVAALLELFWTPGGRAAHERLATRLEKIGALPADGAVPFDEEREEDMFPVLIDAGWELLPLGELDPERHKGAIQAFGDAFAFDVAKFEEESAIPKVAYLQELPAIGAVELLAGVDDEGALAEPLILWIEGNATYHDYVLRGAARAATK